MENEIDELSKDLDGLEFIFTTSEVPEDDYDGLSTEAVFCKKHWRAIKALRDEVKQQAETIEKMREALEKSEQIDNANWCFKDGDKSKTKALKWKRENDDK